MPIPVSQMWTVATYVLKQKLKGRKQYPLVLMLEPLYRCNLACAGCGKIQYPGHVLKQDLTPEQCFAAVEETGVPTVAIPGGEPLMHPQIDQIVAGLVARKKYVYLCTNALLLKEKLHLFTPSKYLTFSVHMDGDRDHHDFSVCKEGGYDIALDAIKLAVSKGFRVTTNTTLFDGVDSKSVRKFFSEMMEAGVEGMMVSPGYSYDKAPDQQHFTGRERNQQLFRKLLSNRDPKWRFNMSMLFLEFLMGKRNLECTPWGMPAYSIFGWQRPCYLQQDGYADTYQELLDSTDWSKYGYESGNAKCENCMLHSGYEATAVHYTFTLPGIVATVKSMLFPAYKDAEALRMIEEEKPKSPLVQIDLTSLSKCETLQGRAAAGGALAEGVEQAFDYRGDVTVRLKSGSTVEGYVYDRQGSPQSGKARLRIMLKNEGGKKMTVEQSEIEELSFTGRDMADGRSFEAWVKKYAEKKAAGEKNIELVPEELD
ncbi:MAG: adenosyl-hopene transferase HpnH [Acidobacteria bacterium]|nr:adenosyl-hopene transferase HpnH [Acidobacteriota bacterium]